MQFFCKNGQALSSEGVAISATIHFAQILDTINPEERHGTLLGQDGLYFLHDLQVKPFFHVYRKIFPRTEGAWEAGSRTVPPGPPGAGTG